MSGNYEDHGTKVFTVLRIEEPCVVLMVGSFLKRNPQPIEKCIWIPRWCRMETTTIAVGSDMLKSEEVEQPLLLYAS